MSSKKILVVAGGGAAGFFCAINAARLNPDLKVQIIEKSSKYLSKVKVSGGGRCNVTHHCLEIPELIKKYPRGQNFLKKAFHWFSPADTIEWFQTHGVALKTEADGRMFPTTDRSETIIQCLLSEAQKYGVELSLQKEIKSFRKEGDKFFITLNDQKEIIVDFLCIACGGFPKESQFEWLVKSGHSIEPPVPSLFSFNISDSRLTGLSGISVENVHARIKTEKPATVGAVLITHWGLSGPAILKLSAFAARSLAGQNYAFELVINWLHGIGYTEQRLQLECTGLKRENATRSLRSKNPFALSARLWEYFLDKANIDLQKRWADLTNAEQQKLIKTLTSDHYAVKGKTTFKEEFVTAGGVRPGEINPNTMESKIVPNLFFAGEILDIDGITGGFNFQHAWTSGWIAAKGIGEKMAE